MQKSKQKKKKKFYKTFSLAVFLFPVIKRAEKVMVFFFFVRGEGKCEIIYKEKKIYISPLRSFFDHFWSLLCRKRWLRSVSGVRRRSREQKKK